MPDPKPTVDVWEERGRALRDWASKAEHFDRVWEMDIPRDDPYLLKAEREEREAKSRLDRLTSTLPDAGGVQ